MVFAISVAGAHQLFLDLLAIMHISSQFPPDLLAIIAFRNQVSHDLPAIIALCIQKHKDFAIGIESGTSPEEFPEKLFCLGPSELHSSSFLLNPNKMDTAI